MARAPERCLRFGRVFLQCPRCSSRVTRLYVPTSDAGWPADGARGCSIPHKSKAMSLAERGSASGAMSRQMNANA